MLANTRARRVRNFIAILAVLNVPLLVVGLLDLSASPLTLTLVLASYGYYMIYFLLLRAGYEVPATYICVARRAGQGCLARRLCSRASARVRLRHWSTRAQTCAAYVRRPASAML
jgi:hypothetical protein